MFHRGRDNLEEIRTVRTLSDLVLEDTSSRRPKDIGVVRGRRNIEIRLMVGLENGDEVTLLNATLLTKTGDLVHAALDARAVAGLDLGRAVVERPVLWASGVLGATRCLGLHIVARVGDGEAGEGSEDEGGKA